MVISLGKFRFCLFLTAVAGIQPLDKDRICLNETKASGFVCVRVDVAS
jgi:hypothetical protein